MPLWEDDAKYTAKQVIKAWKDLKLKVPLECELEEKNHEIEKLKKKNKELKEAVTKYREKMRTQKQKKERLDGYIRTVIYQAKLILDEKYE